MFKCLWGLVYLFAVICSRSSPFVTPGYDQGPINKSNSIIDGSRLEGRDDTGTIYVSFLRKQEPIITVSSIEFR